MNKTITYPTSAALPPSILDPRHAMRDTDVIVGKAYLDLLNAAGLQEDTVEDCDEEDSTTQPLLVDSELLEVERLKADEFIDELIKHRYLIDVWVNDPEGLNGGYWTSRVPIIGDIVTVPSVFSKRFTAQEPCDDRVFESDMREMNRPDVSPFTPIGWEEDPIDVRITLFDVIETLQPRTAGQRPYTLECVAYLANLSTNGYVSYANPIRTWSQREDFNTPRDLLIAVAKDRARKTRNYSPAQWEFLTRNIYITMPIKYSTLLNDTSFWWVESVEELLDQEAGPGNITLYTELNEFEYERKLRQHIHAVGSR